MEATQNIIAETAGQTIPTELFATTQMEQTQLLMNPKDTDFVRIKDCIPNVLVDLKYAGQDNFTGQVIYSFENAYLRYGSVVKLKAVCEELEGLGLYLKIWDSFRPVSAQFQLWEVCPDPTFVANPNVGFSNHSRGNAVDVTLVDSTGAEVLMPSGFDDFSSQADRDYSDCPAEAAENALLLESVMEKHGFAGYWGEWWHYADTQQYDVETCFDPSIISQRCLLAATPLREGIADRSEAILTIPEGEHVTLLGYEKDSAMVEYWGYRGYVPSEALSMG